MSGLSMSGVLSGAHSYNQVKLRILVMRNQILRDYYRIVNKASNQSS